VGPGLAGCGQKDVVGSGRFEQPVAADWTRVQGCRAALIEVALL